MPKCASWSAATTRWAELTSADYRANVDPAMAAVMAYRLEPRLADGMAQALETGGVEAAIRQYREYRSNPRHAYRDTAAEHPASANVHDSPGEAYMLAGRPEQAIRRYRRSLELDPSNENARSALATLRR